VLGALGSRNSYLGIAGNFGAFKLGKTDAPYKLSTARMTRSRQRWAITTASWVTAGATTREFDTRLSHAVWYESPKMGAFSFNALVAPDRTGRATTATMPAASPIAQAEEEE